MKKILFSLLLIGAVVAAISGATLAYFSDTVNSNSNVFGAGTLDLQIANHGSGWADPAVTATWQSPANWAPGDVFTSTVHLRNVGTIPVTYLGVDWRRPSGYEALANKIEVVSWKETAGGVTRDYLDPGAVPLQDYAHLVGNYDGVLTLTELAQSYFGAEPGAGAFVDDWGGHVAHLTDSLKGNGYDVIPLGTPALAAGGEFTIEMAFKLMTDTDNTYQGKSINMNIDFFGAQDISQIP